MAIENHSEVIHFSRNFGFITTNKVILKHDKTEEKIALDTIDCVNLIKYRVLYTNTVLLFLGLGLLAGSLANWHPDKLTIHFLILAAVVILVYSFTHKFYYYRLVIREKNKSTHTIKVSQFKRRSIKNFYHSIIRNTSKKG